MREAWILATILEKVPHRPTLFALDRRCFRAVGELGAYPAHP